MTRVTLLGGAALIAMLGAAQVRATVPEQDIRFEFHSDPDDAGTPVVIRVDLHLVPAKVDGNEVRWSAATLQIAHLDSGGSVTESWTQANAPFDTGSGLWIIDHADSSAPDISEFLQPPTLAGTFANDDSNGPPLVTSFAATGNTTNRTEAYQYNAYLNYSFRRGGESTAIISGSDRNTGTVRPTGS